MFTLFIHQIVDNWTSENRFCSYLKHVCAACVKCVKCCGLVKEEP